MSHETTIKEFLANNGPHSIIKIAEANPISLSTVKKYTKKLVEAGAVFKNKKGLYEATTATATNAAIAERVKAPKSKSKAKAKAKPAQKLDEDVAALVESNAAEVNEALAKPRTKSGRVKIKTILGFRVADRAGNPTKAGVTAKELLKRKTMTQKEIGQFYNPSSGFIRRAVKWGVATFDKQTRTLTLKPEHHEKKDA